MNEAETRAELIDPALKAAGWGMVEGSAYDKGFVNTLTDFAPGANASISRDATSYGPEGPRGISNTFSLSEESILISLNLRTTVS
jgi:hypothetical protein